MNLVFVLRKGDDFLMAPLKGGDEVRIRLFHTLREERRTVWERDVRGKEG